MPSPYYCMDSRSVRLFEILLVILLLHPISAALQDDPNHTCQSNEDCRTRLQTRWRPYDFVCCTTVLCDENYGNYYLVHSGCSTNYNCKSAAQVKDGTRFAARLPKVSWDPLESTMLKNCPKTREKLAQINNASLVTEAPTTTLVTTPPPTPAGGATFQLDLGRCPQLEKICAHAGQLCCVLIDCRDTLQTDTTYYKMEEQCVKSCPLFSQNDGTAYQFFIPPDVWLLRGKYQQEELAPSVSSSCRETRYFYFWAQSRLENNAIDERWRQFFRHRSA